MELNVDDQVAVLRPPLSAPAVVLLKILKCRKVKGICIISEMKFTPTIRLKVIVDTNVVIAT